MALNFPPLQRLTSVHAAFAWLLDEQDTAESHILPIARDAGLIVSESAFHWKSDGEILIRLVEKALPRLPDDASALGQLLHGLGELNARCHAPNLLALLTENLKAARDHLLVPATFAAVVACDNALPRELRFPDHALAQWMTRSGLEWNTFRDAEAYIGHPTDTFGGYGLKFAVRIFLSAAPSIIDVWIDEHPNDPAMSHVGSAALDMAGPFGSKTTGRALLSSSNAALKCLGAAFLMNAHAGNGQPAFTLRDCHRLLVESGFAHGDATWITGARLKHGVHARYRLEHALKQNTGRLRLLEQQPESANGGIRTAEAKMTGLRRTLEQAEKAYNELLPQLEQTLVDLAADWPGDGLTDEQAKSLEFIFVDAEIRRRLADKLTQKADRDRLLTRNIDQFQDFSGLVRKGEEIPKGYFRPDEARFALLADSAAQSLIDLYKSDRRGIGKRTGDIAFAVTQAAEKLLEQPFISARQPDVWQSLTARAAAAHRFSFTVVARTPEDERPSVARLNEMALEHTLVLLCARNLPEPSAMFFFQLTSQAVQSMEFAPDPDTFRTQWATTDALPDFARGVALWASPVLVEKHKGLARDLFGRVCRVPLSRGNRDLQMARMLTLLDMAVSSCARLDRKSLIEDVRDLWKSGYSDWLSITDRWYAIADQLVSAVSGDAAARAAILGNETFSNSRCRRLLEADVPSAQAS